MRDILPLPQGEGRGEGFGQSMRCLLKLPEKFFGIDASLTQHSRECSARDRIVLRYRRATRTFRSIFSNYNMAAALTDHTKTETFKCAQRRRARDNWAFRHKPNTPFRTS